MNKNRHQLLEERNIIEQKLNANQSFKGIGRGLCKDPTTIAKEVKNHNQFRKTGCYGKPFTAMAVKSEDPALLRKDYTPQYMHKRNTR